MSTYLDLTGAFVHYLDKIGAHCFIALTWYFYMVNSRVFQCGERPSNEAHVSRLRNMTRLTNLEKDSYTGSMSRATTKKIAEECSL